jgi:hypothetical protein
LEHRSLMFIDFTFETKQDTEHVLLCHNQICFQE